MAISRKFLVNMHLVLGSFLLPITAMFAITGGLYTFKVTGNYQTKTETVEVAEALSPNLDVVKLYSENLLKEKNLDLPSGAPSIRKSGTSWAFEWTGSRMDFTLEPTENALQYKASFKETSMHRYFVQLHKAKGGLAFKILAAVLAVGLILLLVSGWFMAQSSPALRKIRFFSSIAGVAAFVLAAWLS